MTGGGLTLDRESWVPTSNTFFIHVNVLGALFRGKLLAFLKRADDQGDLEIPSVSSFNALLGKLYSKKWNVDCRKPFAGPQHVVEYLGRYKHRVAISNHRIMGIHNDKIAFR